MQSQVAGDFWSLLDPSDATALEAVAIRRSFTRGHAIWHAGQVADRVLILRAGRVKIFRPAPTGREVVLGFNAPGELIGELAALDGDVRSAGVLALEPVEVLTFSPDEFRGFLASHPSAGLALIRSLGRRLRYSDTKLMEFASLDTLGRVASRLLELSERFGQSDGGQLEIALPITQEELAGWACASLESVARALQTMRSLGWIETRRRAIRVLDVAAVRRAAS
jgi:CRP-like cAMP-binding protein